MPRKHSLYVTQYIVEGVGEFPIDMLRYDCACPETEVESSAITNYREKRRVKLRAYQSAPNGPEIDRWKSFAWTVVEVDGKPV